MEDLHEVGGIPAVMKMLLEAGLPRWRLHDRHRQDLAENLKDLPGLTPGQQIVHPLSEPDQSQRATFRF